MDTKTQTAIKKFPHRAVDIAQSYDIKQIKCKQWLIKELINLGLPTPKRIYVAGSWYGNVLVPLLKDVYQTHIKLHDIDEEAIRIARNIFFDDDMYVKAEVTDSVDFEYKHMVINCSCEHMEPIKMRPGTLCVLQSNNYREVDDHINCVDSPQELARQYELSHTYYTGSLDFPTYTRFMVIGKK